LWLRNKPANLPTDIQPTNNLWNDSRRAVSGNRCRFAAEYVEGRARRRLKFSARRMTVLPPLVPAAKADDGDPFQPEYDRADRRGRWRRTPALLNKQAPGILRTDRLTISPGGQSARLRPTNSSVG
jgi:hypothetical protein